MAFFVFFFSSLREKSPLLWERYLNRRFRSVSGRIVCSFNLSFVLSLSAYVLFESSDAEDWKERKKKHRKTLNTIVCVFVSEQKTGDDGRATTSTTTPRKAAATVASRSFRAGIDADYCTPLLLDLLLAARVEPRARFATVLQRLQSAA